MSFPSILKTLASEPEPVSPTAHLEEKKKTIYENLRDLQFEYRLGKHIENAYDVDVMPVPQHRPFEVTAETWTRMRALPCGTTG